MKPISKFENLKIRKFENGIQLLNDENANAACAAFAFSHFPICTFSHYLTLPRRLWALGFQL
jgi:hypothetical protein